MKLTKKLTKKAASHLLFAMVVLLALSSLAFAETVTVTHNLGTATVVKNPEKVVVFDYAILDSLDQMGVEILGLPKSNIPEFLKKFEAPKYINVGTLFEPNFELIYELEPDVIFISGRQETVYKELAEIAPTVYLAIDTNDYLGSFEKNLTVLGEIFGKEEFVKAEVAKVRSSIEEVSRKVREKGASALILMANDGSLSVYGPGSRFDIIHSEFGFKPADPNIQVANHGQNISFEYLLKINPEYILVIDRGATVGGSISAQQVMDNVLVRSTDAYKKNRIIYLASQVWYVASGGLEGTKTMIEDIEKAIEN